MQVAWLAIKTAAELKPDAMGDDHTSVEHALISALQLRFTWPVSETAPQLNDAYRDAMRKVCDSLVPDTSFGPCLERSPHPRHFLWPLSRAERSPHTRSV